MVYHFSNYVEIMIFFLEKKKTTDKLIKKTGGITYNAKYFLFSKVLFKQISMPNSEQCHIQTKYTTGVHFKRKTHKMVPICKS